MLNKCIQISDNTTKSWYQTNWDFWIHFGGWYAENGTKYVINAKNDTNLELEFLWWGPNAQPPVLWWSGVEMVCILSTCMYLHNPSQSYISIYIYTDGKFRYGAVGFVCVVHQLSGLGGSIFLNVISSSWLWGDVEGYPTVIAETNHEMLCPLWALKVETLASCLLV